MLTMKEKIICYHNNKMAPVKGSTTKCGKKKGGNMYTNPLLTLGTIQQKEYSSVVDNTVIGYQPSSFVSGGKKKTTQKKKK